jgi:hypothetical protein
MKIMTYYDDDAKNYGEYERFVIKVNNKIILSAGHGEPEDNSLGRDLNFVFSIPEWMKMAYEAGKNGEDFNIIESEEDFDV